MMTGSARETERLIFVGSLGLWCSKLHRLTFKFTQKEVIFEGVCVCYLCSDFRYGKCNARVRALLKYLPWNILMFPRNRFNAYLALGCILRFPILPASDMLRQGLWMENRQKCVCCRFERLLKILIYINLSTPWLHFCFQEGFRCVKIFDQFYPNYDTWAYSGHAHAHSTLL